MSEEKNEKPLSLKGLVKYNQEVLFPFLKESFVGKKDLEDFKDDMIKFKDEALQKLTKLTQEKTVGDEQDKRQKKVLEIHNHALVRNKILSEEESKKVDNLRVF